MPSWGDDALWAQGLTGVGQQFTAAAPLAARSRPGRWNDPDMLVVGISWPQFVTGHPGMVLSPAHPDLSADEQRAHFSLWAMLAAPLLAGNDVRAMTSQTRDILTNGEVIAVDQDPLAVQGHALPQDPRVIVKPLVDGAVAVALFNDAAWPADIATDAAALGLPAAACYNVRDLWSHTDASDTGSHRATGDPTARRVMLRGAVSCG